MNAYCFNTLSFGVIYYAAIAKGTIPLERAALEFYILIIDNEFSTCKNVSSISFWFRIISVFFFFTSQLARMPCVAGTNLIMHQ